MALSPLSQQTPAPQEPAKEPEKEKEPTVNVKEPESKAPAVRYFWCSWPDFRIAKPEHPTFQFKGRFLETTDEETAEWILELAAPGTLPCDLKEISKEEYMDGRFDQQVAESSGD